MYDFEQIFKSFVADEMRPFYEELYPGLIAFAVHELGDGLAYLAEDCVQDAVMQSYSIRENFTSPKAWYAYILKCVAHAAVHFHRKNSSHTSYIGTLPPEITDRAIDAKMLEQEILDRLYAVIGSLPDDCQKIIWMSYNEGLKNADIARRLGIAEITVKKKKAKILAALRDGMGDYFPLLMLLFNSSL